MNHTLSRRWLSARVVIGVFVILLGLTFTLDNFGITLGATLRTLLARGWPVVFVLAGIARLLDPQEGPRAPNGYVWILAGAALMAHNFGWVDAWRLWPLALIAVGVLFVWRAFVPPGRPRADPAGVRLDALAVMGGSRRASSAPDFQGGSLLAVMGGVEVDLRSAGIASGEAVLEAFTLWGGIEIAVPHEWEVESRGVALLGGFEDKTRAREPGAPNRPRLVVTGLAVMGGVEIKN
jgi:hypothetical protein